MPEESEFVTFAKVVDKTKKYYSNLVDKLGLDGAYYPVRITVWEVDSTTFKPLKKLIEMDEREIEGGEEDEKSR